MLVLALLTNVASPMVAVLTIAGVLVVVAVLMVDRMMGAGAVSAAELMVDVVVGAGVVAEQVDVVVVGVVVVAEQVDVVVVVGYRLGVADCR